MEKPHPRVWKLIALAALIGLLLLACAPPSAGPTGIAGKPTVIIVAPANGSQVTVDQATVIQANATDAQGVSRIEIKVDGVLVGTTQSPTPQGQPTLTAVQSWTFSQTGSHVIMAQAFNTAGQASDLAVVNVQVVSSVAQQPTLIPTALPGATSVPTVPPPTGAPPPTVPPPTGAPPLPTATSCPPPNIPTFTASPNPITAGGSTTLSWDLVTNATSVSIDQGIGGVGTPGTRVVSPASTTTYVMTAVGCGGTTTKSVTVVVNPPVWSDWQDLDGALASAPTVASWGANRLDVFVRGPADHVWHIWWNGSAWSGWEDLDGLTQDAPAACSWGPDRIDLFARGTDNALWHKYWNGSAWSSWVSLGGALSSAPAVTAWGANRLDVLVRGPSNHLWHKWWNGSAWSGWEDLGGALADAPAVASQGVNKLDVFVRGPFDHVWQKSWTGAAWTDWVDRGGVTNAAPAACSWGANRLDVFARGVDNRLYHAWWDGSAWNGPEDLNGACTSAPAAVSRGPNHLDVFVRGPFNHLFHKWK